MLVRKRLTYFIAAVAMFFCASGLVAEEFPSNVQHIEVPPRGVKPPVVWEFGTQHLIVTDDAAVPLMERAFGAAGLARMGVLTRVGGVNLEGVAVVSPHCPPNLRTG